MLDSQREGTQIWMPRDNGHQAKCQVRLDTKLDALRDGTPS